MPIVLVEWANVALTLRATQTQNRILHGFCVAVETDLFLIKFHFCEIVFDPLQIKLTVLFLLVFQVQCIEKYEFTETFPKPFLITEILKHLMCCSSFQSLKAVFRCFSLVLLIRTHHSGQSFLRMWVKIKSVDSSDEKIPKSLKLDRFNVE